MMLRTTPLLKKASEKQLSADQAFATYGDPIKQAMALAEFFEAIEAEEYVIPAFAQEPKRSDSSLDLHTISPIYSRL